MQNNVQAQMESLYATWQTLKNIPEDLSSVVVAGFTKQNIDDALKAIIEITKQINEDESFEPDMISLGTAQNRLNVLKAYVSSNLPSNAEGHLPGFVLNIELLRNNLLEWADQADTRKQRVSKALIQKLGDANAQAEEMRRLHAELKNLQEELVSKSNAINELYEKVNESEANFDATLERTTQKSGEVARLEQKTTQSAERLETHLSELSDLKGEVEEARDKQEKLFDEFEGYRDTINQTLGDANRVSMAGAFITQRDKYDQPLESWNRIFILSIVVLIFMAVWVVAPFMTSGNWVDSLIRLPLSAPAIWLAWFASRQYGHISKLREDYAYKAAAAMAFEGYKREASEAGDDMQAKLLDTAINQLGDNPIRIYQNHEGDHADPVNEFLDRHFKDKKFIDAFTNLIKAIRG